MGTDEAGGEDDTQALDEADVEHEIEADPILEYVIAHGEPHLSPVISRGLTAEQDARDRNHGEEFKITKAPRKTLAALCTFAGHRYQHVVILHDQFEAWAAAPSDIRGKIASGVSEVRWAIAPVGMIAIAIAPGMVPELEEQFAAATIVDLGLPGTRGTGSARGEALPTLVGDCGVVCRRRQLARKGSFRQAVYTVVRDSLENSESLGDFRDLAAKGAGGLVARGLACAVSMAVVSPRAMSTLIGRAKVVDKVTESGV